MERYDYLIVGGGMTGDAAVRGIREVDKQGSIGLIGSEPDAPYNRPPLTKGLWKGKPVDKIIGGTAGWEPRCTWAAPPCASTRKTAASRTIRAGL